VLRAIRDRAQFITRTRGEQVELRQVGKELGVCYVLEGSIRRVGDRVRITGQLVDATTGAHRWAERYDRKLEDVFAVRDEVAQTIAGLLAAHVNKAEAERALLKPPSAWQAYDYYIRAADLLARHLGFLNIGQVYQARQLSHKQSQPTRIMRVHTRRCRSPIGSRSRPRSTPII